MTVVLTLWWLFGPVVGYGDILEGGPAGNPTGTIVETVMPHVLYMVSHASFWHLLGNVFVLWMVNGRLFLWRALAIAFLCSWLPGVGSIWEIVNNEPVALTVGFSGVLFAIFGIIKYRTEQVPIREMTYMFVIIAVAAINGLATSVSYFELLGTNLIFIIALAICENTKWMKHVPSKLIKYDNVKLVAHGKEEELKADLEKRLGLKIIRIEVGNVDFLKDSAIIKIYYEPIMDEFGTIDSVMKTGKIK